MKGTTLKIETEEDYQEYIKDVVLPEAVSKLLDPIPPKMHITYEDGEYFVRPECGHKVSGRYSTVEEAYDSCRKNTNDWFEIVLDESLEGHGGSFFLGGTGTFLAPVKEDPTKSRFLLSESEKLSLDIMKQAYREFLEEIVPAYDTNPDDLVNASNFLTNHPAFWWRAKSGQGWSWATDLGLDKMEMSIYRNDDNEAIVRLEHGHSVEDDYTHRYGDDRLTSRSDSIDKSLVMLAKKVRVTYNLDGSDIPEA